MKNTSNYKSAKCIVMVFLMMLFVTAANAVPAKPGQKRQITLTDGTTVSATLVGDEHGHFWLASDGTAYQATDNDDVYRVVDKQAIIKNAKLHRSKVNSTRVKRLPRHKKADSFGNYTGPKKGLIILVNFPDRQFKDANDNNLYQRIANEKGFSEGNFKGSMYDYFYDQSGKKLELTFDVVGPVTVEQSASYYGRNDSQGNDLHPGEMVIEALKLVDEDVDFTQYDWEGDGEVDQVYVIYAGKGEADGGAGTTIWPHAYTLHEAETDMQDGDGPQTLDGVVIDTYACGSELNGSGRVAGIGTMCHEFSHCLGYPDFYDIDYSGGQGMFMWDLMDNGSYNDDGYLPAGYTGYERWMAGWSEPIELTKTKQVDGMLSLQDGGEFYIIYNNGCRDEYFILENRQLTGWDAGLPGKGLLIVHVDYDADVWAANVPNDDPKHQRMTWIAADNKYQYEMYLGEKYYTEEGAKNDPFPYGKVNAFNKSTTPAAKFYNNNTDGTKYLDTSVENITQDSKGVISFLFRGISNVATPVFTPKAGRYEEAQTVSISCETEDASIFYTIDGSTPTVNSTSYTQPFVVSETTTVKAVAVKGEDESAVATAKYAIGVSASNPDAMNFKLVASEDEMESGMRYVIGRGDKAAGDLDTKILSKVEVENADDIITLNDDVAVFIVEEMNGGWSFKNEKTDKYLVATATKVLAYVDEPEPWTLGTNEGVTMTFGDYGTMLYNVNSPRFTTYTSNPSATMLQAHLYMETEEGPVQKKEVKMAFSEEVVEVTLGNEFTEPVLTIDPADIPVTYSSSNTSVATVDATTGKVTVKGIGTTEIIASFTGNDIYEESSASYLVKVKKPASPAEKGSYELVTDASVLKAGQQVMIAANYGDEIWVMSTTQNAKNRAATDDVTVNDNGTLVPSEAALIIMLEKNGSNFLFSIDDGYLYAASSSSNWLMTEDTPDDNAKADISIDDKGLATIVFQGSNTRNHLRFNPNNGSPIFSAYGESSTVKTLPMIYRMVVDNPTTGIAVVNQDNTTPTVYNLQGQRISGRQMKGIYIINGRKVMK